MAVAYGREQVQALFNQLLHRIIKITHCVYDTKMSTFSNEGALKIRKIPINRFFNTSPGSRVLIV